MIPKNLPNTTGLSAEERELFAYLLEAEGVEVAQPQTIFPRPPTAGRPLSFAQERLWFLDQLAPGGAAYNIVQVLRLTGELNLALLARSFRKVAHRHTILRATFANVEGQPRQEIGLIAELPLSVIDLSALPQPRRQPEARRLVAAEAGGPFDLARGPLWRVVVLQEDSQSHLLLLTLHHIVADAGSVEILIRDIAAFYQALVKGQPAPLTDLPIQYVDFAFWQREWLQGNVLETQLNYWKAQLAGAPALLDLPTDRPRPAVQTFRGANQWFELSPGLTQALKALSQAEGVTLFMLLLTAFQTLLQRYTGQTDIVVGSPIANRRWAETEALVGLFANTLALRTQLAGNPTFREALHRVREVCLEAYAHQDLPFEKLVEALQPERNLSYQPLFQVMFVLQNMPREMAPLAGLRMKPVRATIEVTKFDWTFFLWEGKEALGGAVEYSTDLFEASTIQRALDHWQIVLAGIVANPDTRLADLPLLTEGERQQLRAMGDATQSAYPADRCLPHLLEAQARQTPDAVAVTAEDHSLTYEALNTRANQLAHHLQQLGVGPNTLVGICVERSSAMMIGLLGSLKAGGAYVPLDPGFPAERLGYMLADSQISVLLTQTSLQDKLPACEARLICLDSDWPEIARLPTSNLAVNLRPEQRAYVLYTSGSTGRPKGVQISHRALVNCLWSMRERPGLNADDIFLAVTTISFDIAALELFLPLLVGAQVWVASREVAADPTRLSAALQQSGTTVMQATPATWRMLLAAGWAGQPGLKVLCGGEALPGELAEQLRPRVESVWNMYGPTETTIWSAVSAVEQTSALPTIPLGQPIANTQLYVLDAQYQVVPHGVTGELYIGGEGLAWGYLNRPELTAEKFIPNPLSPTPGARLYRTQDLARYRSTGQLEFLGRADQQVKINGFRIELGEIESILHQHLAVREAVVVAREDTPGERRLVAYIVGERDLTLTRLQDHLRDYLPLYMLPAAFVFLNSLPLTPNGKVDRRALPMPAGVRPTLPAVFVPPRTAIEISLAAAWRQILGLDRVGVEDNFFALGGNSILSIRLIARAQRLGLHLTPQQLFQHQTIAALAQVATFITESNAEQSLAIGPVPLTPLQRFFFSLPLSNPHYYNIATLLETEVMLDLARLRQALAYLLRQHDMLRMRFISTAEGWQATLLPPDAQPLDVSRIDLAGVPSARQSPAIEAAVVALQRSLHLTQGPLLRVVYFDLGPRRSGRLLLLFHHLLIDGLSIPIVLEDLLVAYQQLSQSQPVRLPPKTTSLKAWAERLTHYAQSAALRAELDYWLALPWDQVRPLPADYADGRVANTQGSLKTMVEHLTEAETQALISQLYPASPAQVIDFLLAALGQAFAPWLAGRPLLVEVLGHGRHALFEELDLSRMVGWFSDLVPVFVPAGDAGAVLQAVVDQRKNMPQRGSGYFMLRYLCPDPAVQAAMQALPHAEVMINYRGHLPARPETTRGLRPANESVQPEIDPQNKRLDTFWCQGEVVDNRLQMSFAYSTAMYAPATVAALTQRFQTALRNLIAHGQPVCGQQA